MLHLGDILMSNQNDTGKYDTQEVVNSHLSKYYDRMRKAKGKSLIILGNHDGLLGSAPTENGSYPAIGTYSFCERPKDKPYFFFDNINDKVRCVCLVAPYIKDGKETWAFGEEQINWLIDTALNVDDGWHVLFFSHAPLFSTDIIVWKDYADIAGIINAFNNHTTFETSKVKTADFSSKASTKSVAWICGHEHYDMVVRDNSYYTHYNLVCPIIITACNYRYGLSGNVPGATYPTRKANSVTEDLLDTMVYRRDENKVYMVRFGAGEDREVNV